MVEPMVLLRAHVEDFNHGVRTGDFAPMMQRFTVDAELRFEGVDAGPFVGREAIWAAYEEQPPDDLVAVESVHADDGALVCEYRWASEPDRVAGEMRFELEGDQIRRLVVTFAD